MTPDQARSSSTSQEATEADLREARQLLSEEGALRKTGWLLLRSTAPGLTDVLQYAGATGLSVRQLYQFSFDPSWLIHCFILLYKWAPDRGDSVRWNPERLAPMFATPVQDDSGAAGAEHIMFCGQTMDNASATQALIMALLNIPECGGGERIIHQELIGGEGVVAPFDIGEQLRILKAFMKPMDPVLRAAAMCSADVVRSAHNRAASKQLGGHPELLDEDGKVRSSLLAEELWMYSVFIPGKNNYYIYELQSMADEAKVADTCTPENGETWTSSIEHSISKKINTFREHHTPFLLFAVTSGIKAANLPRIPRKGRQAEASLQEDVALKREQDSGSRSNFHGREDEDTGESDEEYDEELAKEELARIRAVHNYDTFFVEMMKLMASKGHINSIIKGDSTSEMCSSDKED